VLGWAECTTLGKPALYRAQNFAEGSTRQSLLCRVPDKKHSAKARIPVVYVLGRTIHARAECLLFSKNFKTRLLGGTLSKRRVLDDAPGSTGHPERGDVESLRGKVIGRKKLILVLN
jgi:hypothetical protein